MIRANEPQKRNFEMCNDEMNRCTTNVLDTRFIIIISGKCNITTNTVKYRIYYVWDQQSTSIQLAFKI